MAKLGAVEEEFGGADLGDARRNARLLKLAASVGTDPGASFPELLTESELEGAYRFFSNEAVTAEAVLKPHRTATLERMTPTETHLVVHDSSTMSFASDGHREGLSESTGGHQHFLAHVSLAVAADGSRRAHGVLEVSHHEMTLVKKTKGQSSRGRLQDRWVNQVERVSKLHGNAQRLVHVMDREADDYEVFAWMQRNSARFVVRSHHDRALKDGGRMSDRIPSIVARAERSVRLNARSGPERGSKQSRIHPNREERDAKLEVSGAPIVIKRTASATASDLEVGLNLVVVREIDPPDPKSAVEWLLLTSEPIDSETELLQIIDWYRARWVIEELFKALKTGCAFERRQLGSLHALKNALAMLLPIAWRLLLLRAEARSAPDAPATSVLTRDELAVLRHAARRPLPESPSVRDALLAIAGIGGHLRRNGEPGWQVLGRGFERLEDLVTGWRIARAAKKPKRSGGSDQS